MKMSADTIFALSSGSPPAAVALVRVSGLQAAKALEALAGRVPRPRSATLAQLRDSRGDPLDRALVLFLPGPGSATGEDIVELHLHGGRAVVAAVLEALAEIDGLRAAKPGEFTRRAFENGRIDLAEAEGLADLLAAETQSQRRVALASAGGALSRQVDAWRKRMVVLSAAIEAALDFSDEGEVGGEWPPGWRTSAAALAGELEAFLARPPSERLRDGVRVAIAGPVNAGKSSLLNYLVQREAAITSPIAGTTRDVIEVPVAAGGVPFVLMDTAGLRDSADEVEAIGVRRARDNLAAADLILWLGNPEENPNPGRTIVVRAKCDLSGPAPLPPGLPVSAVTGEGMDRLMAELLTRARELLPTEGEVVANGRQRGALGNASGHVAAASKASDMLIAAEELRSARASLNAVTGGAGVEEVLDALFERFCIGK
jgi:tRNA modification GTPase